MVEVGVGEKRQSRGSRDACTGGSANIKTRETLACGSKQGSPITRNSYSVGPRAVGTVSVSTRMKSCTNQGG